MKKSSKPNYGRPKFKLAFDSELFLCAAVPLCALLIVTWKWSTVLVIASGFSLWAAIPIAFVGGVVAIAAGTAASGTDASDLMVSSIIIAVLSLMLGTVLVRQHQLHEKIRAREALRLKTKPAQKLPSTQLQKPG